MELVEDRFDDVRIDERAADDKSRAERRGRDPPAAWKAPGQRDDDDDDEQRGDGADGVGPQEVGRPAAPPLQRQAVVALDGVLASGERQRHDGDGEGHADNCGRGLHEPVPRTQPVHQPCADRAETENSRHDQGNDQPGQPDRPDGVVVRRLAGDLSSAEVKAGIRVHRTTRHLAWQRVPGSRKDDQGRKTQQ